MPVSDLVDTRVDAALAPLRQRLRDFRALTFKHEATPLTAFIGTLIVLGGLSVAQSAARFIGASDAMLAIGSFASVCTLLFASPAAPLGIPWNMVMGHAVSVGVALLVHWTELLSGLDLHAQVLVPSAAIALQMQLGAVNPPAAAAAEIFASDPLAQRQPLYGAFFLIAPALVGTAWSLSVQYATARALAAWKARRRKRVGPEAPAPEPTVKVSVVDPAVAICVVQAIEGAAYVDDPLSYLIETLTADRRRLDLQKRILKRMLSVDPRQVAQVSRIQRVFRAHIAMRRMRTMV